MQQSGFYGVAQLGFISLDWYLITTLIERWNLETHTFHVPQGECTITLHDVSIILSLPIDGVAVSGSTCLDWREVCATLLGAVLEERDIFGQRLHLTWLIEHFPSLSLDANVEFVRCYVRAFILQLIRGFLFADKSNNRVHLMFLPLLEDLRVTGTYS